MSIQLVAIMLVLGFVLGVLFLAIGALAACQVSSRISRHEESLAFKDADNEA